MKRLWRKYLYKFLAVLLISAMAIGMLPTSGAKAAPYTLSEVYGGVILNNGDTIVKGDGASPASTINGESIGEGSGYTVISGPFKSGSASKRVTDESGGVTYTIVLVSVYTVTWQDYNRTVLGTDSVGAGDTPWHADPTRDGDAQYGYTFSGWTGGSLNGPTLTGDLPPVFGDVTYTATYTQFTNQYPVDFYNEDGQTGLYGLKAVKYGDTPVYGGTTPVKAEDEDYTYTFDGWTTTPGSGTVITGELPAVTGITVYYAHFTATPKAPKTYTVSFSSNGGSGTMNPQIIPCGVSTALDRNAFTYAGHTFAGWEYRDSDGRLKTVADGASVKDLTTAGGRITLTAKWEDAPTATPTATPTVTPTVKPTATPTATPVPSGTDGPSGSPAPSGSVTPTPVPSGTDGPSVSPAPSGSATPTPVPSGTDGPSGSPAVTPTATPVPSGTDGPSGSPAPSGTPSGSPTPSGAANPSPSATVNLTPSVSATPTPTPVSGGKTTPTPTPKPNDNGGNTTPTPNPVPTGNVTTGGDNPNPTGTPGDGTTTTGKAKKYKITYYVDGKKNKNTGNPATYYYGIGCSINKGVDKEGYEFLGWATKKKGGKIISQITKKDKGNKKLYARYQKLQYEEVVDDDKDKPDTDEGEGKVNTGFGLLFARMTKYTKNSITIKWKKLKNVDGYDIYGSQCNSKDVERKYKYITTLGPDKNTYKATKLLKATYYKYYVEAFVMEDGKKKVITRSALIHGTTVNPVYGVAESLTLNETEITLKVGETFTLVGTEHNDTKIIRPHRPICFESSDKKIAKVSVYDGVIKAKKVGKCKIWVYAQNGIYTYCTVNVVK